MYGSIPSLCSIFFPERSGVTTLENFTIETADTVALIRSRSSPSY